MKKYMMLVLCLPFGLILAAEEAVEAAPAVLPLAKAIQPRAAGASWTYASYEYEDGVKTLAGTVTERVVQTLELEGQTCFKIRMTYDYRSVVERIAGVKLTKEDHDDFWEYFNAAGSHHFEEMEGDAVRDPKSLAEFQLTLPFPVEKGHTFKAFDDEWTVLEVAREIEVPAGSFTSVVYQTVSREGDEEDWYRERFFMVPGVGLVCFEIDRWEDGKWVLDMRDELMNFRLPAPEADGE